MYCWIVKMQGKLIINEKKYKTFLKNYIIFFYFKPELLK